jgi:hypothetical protein
VTYFLSFWGGGMMKLKGISLVGDKNLGTDYLEDEDENGRKDECLLKK